MEQLIIEVLNSNKEVFGLPNSFKIEASTVLYGENGILSSIFLVHFLVELEEKIYKKFSRKILLVSADTLSKAKGPFFTVKTLALFVESLI